jgi:integrase
MPRPTKGARLYLHPKDRQWLIRDGSITRRTGCGEADRAGAEKRLGEYISEKFEPVAREGDLHRIPVTEVLTAYGREHAPHTRGKTPETIGYCIAALAPWWADKTMADIRGATCRGYMDHRRTKVGDAKIRRELGVLSSAIGHWHREHGPLESVPEVTLPAEPPGKERWLTRSEAALLLAGSLGFYVEAWSDIRSRQVHQRWRRYRGGINRHVARFILLGLYTGTRKAAILETHWMPNTVGGWVDLDRGVYHRRGSDEGESKKKRPKVRIGRRLLAHLKRWKRIDDEARAKASMDRPAEEQNKPLSVFLHVVTWMGRPVGSVRTSWAAAVELAWLSDDVTPHVLRHTRATWLMQARVDLWEESGFLGMSVKTLEQKYGHHHPDWQQDAAEA